MTTLPRGRNTSTVPEDPFSTRWDQFPGCCSTSNCDFRADWDGTVMEQRGRNRWQTLGSHSARERLDLGETFAIGCQRLPFGSHGKQGVCHRLRKVPSL